MMYLTPMEINNQRIITTKVLAEQYGTSEDNIKTNFNRNKERFVEGKHYYQLQGEALKDFKRVVTESNDPFIKFASVLTLWTDRGAARHAKILDTDEAWDVYEALEDTYFKVVNNQIEATKQPIGVMESLQSELQIIRQELAELKEMTYVSKQLKMLRKKKTLQSELKVIEDMSHIEDEVIIEIIRASMPLGFLRELKGNIALDRIVVIETAEKMGVDRGDFNKKLKLMGISKLSEDGGPCPKEYMPKFKANVRCYSIIKNQI